MRLHLFSLLVLFLTLVPQDSFSQHPIMVSPLKCNEMVPNNSDTFLDDALAMLNQVRSDVTIELLPGVHCIQNFTTILEGLSNVTIIGNGSSTTINCMDNRGLTIFNAKGLTIRNIVFDSCGVGNDLINEVIYKLNEITYFLFNVSENSMSNITLICGHCIDLTMTQVTINNTLGLGFLGVNLIGKLVWEDNVFSYNVPTGCYYPSYNLTRGDNIGGGAILVYVDYRPHFMNNSLTDDAFIIGIYNSQFLYNSYCSILYATQFFIDYVNDMFSSFFLSGGGGLTLHLTQMSYKVNFTVSDSLFKNNTARSGAGAHVQVLTGVYNSSIEFVNCNFTSNGLKGDIVQEYNFITSASGLVVSTNIYNPRIRQDMCLIDEHVTPTSVLVRDTKFLDNRAFSGAAATIVSLYSPGQRRNFPQIVKFISCQFSGNYAYSASALLIQEWKYLAAQPGLSVILRNVSIVNNTNFVIRKVSSNSISSGIIHVIATNVTFLENDNIIRSNEGTGLYLDHSILHVSGSVSFINNSASLGGGVRLEGQSLLIVGDNSEVNFIENKASIYGGGIFSNNNPALNELRINDCPIYFGELSLFCFRNFAQECTDITVLNTTISFKANSAPFGNMVFGTTLDTCPWANQLRNSTTGNLSVFEILYLRGEYGLPSPMKFDIAPNTSQAVATLPESLIITNASNETDPISVVPGHPFQIQTHINDQFHRPAFSVVTSLINQNGQIGATGLSNNRSSVGITNYLLLQGNSSAQSPTIPVTVFASPGSEDFDVFLVGVGSYVQDMVRVHVIDCPTGFTFDNTTKSCDCDKRFNDFMPRVLCYNDGSFSVPPDLWIGFYDDNSTLAMTSCHFDYCVTRDKNVSGDDFDSQCMEGYNRGGVGCGGCKDGYGLTLGENRCRQCSNWNIFLIFGFLLIGIVQISLMSALRISVANGYFNGILFYSSVITLFYPVLSSNSKILENLLRLFAWLNLNVGFELCFYENMTAFQASALGYVYPIYLYILMGVIVAWSRCSQWFASRFNRGGFTATKLFATLFVMTYTSIMNNSIGILGYNTVTFLDGTQKIVWKIDSNQPYFEGFHIPLCLIAIAFILVYLIPAPLILLSPSLALRLPFLRNYKPLYDVFWAPFKPKFRFWIGLRLLLRFLPLIFVNFIPNPTNVLFLVTFLLALCFAQAVFHPYEGRFRNASDMFLLFDLLVLTVGYLHFYVFEFNSRRLLLSNVAADMLLKIEEIYYIFTVSCIYLLLLIFSIARIFARFPILKYYLWKVVTKIFFCKSFEKWIPKQPIVSAQKRQSYGTIQEKSESTNTSLELSFDSDNTDPNRRPVATFSELREPLLESGSAEIDTVTHS